jgi:hypothetical protein
LNFFCCFETIDGQLVPAARNDLVLELRDDALQVQLNQLAHVRVSPASADRCSAEGPGLLSAKRTPPPAPTTAATAGGSSAASVKVSASDDEDEEEVIVANQCVENLSSSLSFIF